MDVVTLDFETFYSNAEGYTLSKISTEDYVMDDRFEIIGCAAFVNDKAAGWFSGTHGQTVDWLRKLDLPNKVMAGHHLMFDGLIAQARCDIVPAYYACTESMSRPFLKPILKSLSLGSVAAYLDIGIKRDDVIRADGMRRKDFTPEQLRVYLEEYCLYSDCHMTRGVYNHFRPMLNSDEMLLIDSTIRMYTCPQFSLDAAVYDASLKDVRARKAKTLAEMEVQGIDGATLRSNQKFAKLLEDRGIEVPMKPSPTSVKKGEVPPKMTYAFGKADPEFIALREEYADDLEISVLLDARVSEKSTIEETRNEALLELARKYPRFRIDVSYYNAHTGRFSAGRDDKAQP